MEILQQFRHFLHGRNCPHHCDCSAAYYHCIIYETYVPNIVWQPTCTLERSVSTVSNSWHLTHVKIVEMKKHDRWLTQWLKIANRMFLCHCNLFFLCLELQTHHCNVTKGPHAHTHMTVLSMWWSRGREQERTLMKRLLFHLLWASRWVALLGPSYIAFSDYE